MKECFYCEIGGEKLSFLSESWSCYIPPTNKNDVVMTNIRLQSAAGWYLGAIEFYNFDEYDYYSRDSEYYPSEEMLKTYYPNTISIEEAFNKLQYDRLWKGKIERKLRGVI